ncbi:hypothetical protein ACIQI7_22430 [Kitasatospora sp. NPDC092039]|uniref:hypothetical protein n=1 Tax=Kitasatospora sp. NPDC092039 TaxID=3364086 RepID=UPI00382046A8
MDTKALQDRIESCFKDGTLTVTAANLDTQAASRQLAAWFPGGLTLHDATLENAATGVTAAGSLAGWPAAQAIKTTVVFGIDPADQSPSLYAHLVLPVSWTFGAAFPKIKGLALDRLTYAEPPLLLLTSTKREAADGLPDLPPGMTFHAPKAKPPTDSALAFLLPLTDGALTLTGPLMPADKNGRPGVDLRSRSKAGQDMQEASFLLWAGSRDLDTPTPYYNVELRADVRISKTLTVEIGTSLQSGPATLILTGAPPKDPVAASDLKDFAGLDKAFTKADKAGFPLGDTLQLRDVLITIDPTNTGGSLAKALRQVTVDIDSAPGRTWDIAEGNLKLTGVGAELSVFEPLQSTRSAWLVVRARFEVADKLPLLVEGIVPPGTLTVADDTLKPVPLKDVVQHFLPGTDLGHMPAINLTDFWGEVTPTTGTFSMAADADTNAALELGAATITLTQAGFALQHDKKNTTASLNAIAVVAPTGKPLTDGIKITAACAIPGSFRLSGQFPTVSLTDLIKQLAADTGLSLPSGMPAITFSKTTASVQYGQGWELALSGDVTYDKYTLSVVGKAARPAGESTGKTTVLVVGLWQENWSFSPRDIGAWAKDLPILGDLTFTDSGLVVSTADQQNIDTGTVKKPKGLPATVGKGLTFFSTLGFGGDLAFLTRLFPSASGITVTARLASPIKNSEFAAVLAKAGNGFGALTLTVKPATYEIALATAFVLQLPAAAGSVKLQLTGQGAVSKPSAGGWALSLKLVLTPAKAYGAAAGKVPPHQLALALDAPGYTLLTPDPEPAPAGTGMAAVAVLTPAPAALERLLCDLTALGHTPVPVLWTAPPAAGTDALLPWAHGADVPYALLVPTPHEVWGAEPLPGPDFYDSPPAWKNAFGIDGFTINGFFVEISLKDGKLVLGGGGELTFGSGNDAVTLDLTAKGSVEPPMVTVFYFALKPADTKKGVSLHDIAALVTTPPSWLDILKKIVIHQLEVCLVTDAGGWKDDITKTTWQQGLFASGDIDFFDNNWRFKVEITRTGIYVDSEIEKPLTIAKLLTLSSATDQAKGPHYLLDLKNITSGNAPKKILALSGKVELLGASASLDASLGKDGFAFDLKVKVGGFTADLACTLDLDSGLTAKATATLDFSIDAPSSWKLTGTVLDVNATGSLTLTVTKDQATVSLALKATVTLTGGHLPKIDLSVDDLGITSFEDIINHFKNTPKLIYDQLGTLGDDVKNCAVNTAEGKL